MKYHAPTGFGFSPKASGFYSFGEATALPSEGGGFAKRLFFMFFVSVPPVFIHRAQILAYIKKQTKGTVLLVCGLCGLLEIRHATALTTGAKHWHRQKAVFYVFVSVPPRIYPLNPNPGIYIKETRTQRVSVRVWNI